MRELLPALIGHPILTIGVAPAARFFDGQNFAVDQNFEVPVQVPVG